jgi:integrase
VLPGPGGGNRPVGEETLRIWFRRACEISGVDECATLRDKQVRPHDLRAGGATAADELGARPSAIRDALGHSSLVMTERYLRSEGRKNVRSVAAVMSQLSTSAPVRPRPRRAGRKAVA